MLQFYIMNQSKEQVLLINVTVLCNLYLQNCVYNKLISNSCVYSIAVRSACEFTSSYISYEISKVTFKILFWQIYWFLL